MRPITAKEIKLLQLLAKGEPVLASWFHQNLCDLQRAGHASSTVLLAANGKLSASKLWTITDMGRRFLTEERAGQ